MHLNYMINHSNQKEGKVTQLDDESKTLLFQNLNDFTQKMISEVGEDLKKVNHLWLLNSGFLKFWFFQFYWEDCTPHSDEDSDNDEATAKLTDDKDLKIIAKFRNMYQEDFDQATTQFLKELETVDDCEKLVLISKLRDEKDGVQYHKSSRGSKFRGVSLNGKNWQVFIVINKNKWYAGCVESELKAAALYDKLAILFHGDKVWILSN